MKSSPLCYQKWPEGAGHDDFKANASKASRSGVNGWWKRGSGLERVNTAGTVAFSVSRVVNKVKKKKVAALYCAYWALFLLQFYRFVIQNQFIFVKKLINLNK
jgi:hypothetical protein